MIFIIAIFARVAYHTATGNAQPNDHKYARYTDQDIQQSFQPNHTESYPVNDVETENTHGKPVDCADDGQDKRDNGKYVKGLFQNDTSLCFCNASICSCKNNIRENLRGVRAVIIRVATEPKTTADFATKNENAMTFYSAISIYTLQLPFGEI